MVEAPAGAADKDERVVPEPEPFADGEERVRLVLFRRGEEDVFVARRPAERVEVADDDVGGRAKFGKAQVTGIRGDDGISGAKREREAPARRGADDKTDISHSHSLHQWSHAAAPAQLRFLPAASKAAYMPMILHYHDAAAQ